MAPRTAKKPAAKAVAKSPRTMTVNAYLAAAPKDKRVALYGSFDVGAPELKAYDQSGKGTIRFPAEQPLPYALVTKVVKARVAEIDEAR